MKVVLLGPNGQVGTELRRALAPMGHVISLARADGGDLDDPAGMEQRLRALAPDAVVNAAAYTAVDRAESEPALAERVNADGPTRLAEVAASLGARLVHYSTDYVFNGTGERPWQESDEPAPLNVYGGTKWRGEQGVRASSADALILRTQWVYARRGRNFIRTMLHLASERHALQVINDQRGAPTGAALIADATAHALRAFAADPALSGTYHLAASGDTSWYEYARFVIERARAWGYPTRVAPSEVEAVATEAFPMTAERPRNSRLDCRALERDFGLVMPDWRDEVARVVDEMVGRPGAE